MNANVEQAPTITPSLRSRLRGFRLMRQIHLWVGAWGALAAILFGITGFIQNHRAILKIPQGDSTEISKVELTLPESARTSPDALRDWLVADHHLDVDAMRVQNGGSVEFNGERIKQPARWMFNGGNARISWQAEYTTGNATVSVRTSQQSTLAVMSRLHKGVGGGVPWILLTDSFAFALVALGLSGIYMWARGRNARQIVFSIVGVAVVALLVIGGMAVL